jgi:hypothetical protein
MSEAPPRISVLIPVGSDAGDLRELHGEIAREIAKLGEPHELIYLVQAQRGPALDQALALHEDDPERVRVLCFTQPVGEGAMLRAGFEASRGALIFTVPAYFEVDASDLYKLREAIEQGADLAVGSRSAWKNPGWLQSHLFNRMVAWATGEHYSDVASRTRALRREVLDEVHVYGDFDRYLPALAHRMGFAVREVPVRQNPRTQTPLLHTPGTYLWRLLDVLSIFFLSRFTRHPLRLFGGVGSAFVAFGALILGVAIFQRLALGVSLADRPVLVLGALLLGLGVQLFTIGLLGELILFFHARTIRDYRIAAVYESES